jgi:excisionase family DNA binding protein
MTPAAPGPWLTADEAAAYLRLPSRRALYKRVERGQVRAHRWGRQLRFHRRDLDALLGSAPVSAVAQED